ncbi:related to dehydrogenase/reductase SDR family member 7 precursor [Fusarium mangiferae]|uniref:Related to dehydrogenase/reductase SDR family member 7 n=1 Tax=Fusarium mangiferae TaxID=192010 RepID=A0A1L7SSM9_FUSMA|nr:uncharacterized protein FMAN_06445 [Fusarium mangiferae]CVK86196.1 related to dehydrogenase/reductase SDR family member 7 precursor [Fusarium mangiferae]
MSTPSLTNAQQVRDFVETKHDKPYDAINPRKAKLPEGFVVCIIGAGGAAGSGLARSFAQAGVAGMIIAARSQKTLEATATEIGDINALIKVTSVVCDITSNESVANIASTVKSQFNGRLDAVFVNCGFSGPLSKATVLEEDFEDVQKAFATHCLGTWLLQLALQYSRISRSIWFIISVRVRAGGLQKAYGAHYIFHVLLTIEIMILQRKLSTESRYLTLCIRCLLLEPLMARAAITNTLQMIELTRWHPLGWCSHDQKAHTSVGLLC